MADLSQKEIADRLGWISQTAYLNFEKSNRPISVKRLSEIALLLNSMLNSLLINQEKIKGPDSI